MERSQKFSVLYDKYGSSYTLANPSGGSLDRQDTEGPSYRLQDRLSSLANEFMERCPAHV